MKEFQFRLKGKTLVIIDWANVYGWFKKLKWEIDPKKLYDYLKSYPEIYEIRFYFGIDKENEKSKRFHQEIKEIGYNLISKEVKLVPTELKIGSYFKDKNGQIKKLTLSSKEEKLLYDEIKRLQEKFQGLSFYRRKCDFDVEITLDVLKNLDNFDGLILFSGDGDYAILVQELISRGKQVIVVALKGAMGKEYTIIPKGLYICNVKKLKKFIQK